MTHSIFPGLDKNLRAVASSALRGIRLSTQTVFCLLRLLRSVSVLVYFYSAITARAIDILTSVLFVFLDS
jgi:hypothetical protein